VQVKQYLKKKNPSWQIPDRRLRKFLKSHSTTQSSESAKALALSDDVSQISNTSKRGRFGGLLSRKIFSMKANKSSNNSNNSANNNHGGAPVSVVEIQTPTGLAGLPAMDEEDYALSPVNEGKATVSAGSLPREADISLLDESATGGDAMEESMNPETIYAHENNREKEKPCFAFCGSCIIM
jgi:hypothetical protein